MKTILLLLSTLIASVQLNAQCYAQINYQNTPNALISFWADSLNGVSNTTTFTWDFGDGNYGNGNQTTHLFSTPMGVTMTYNVCLTLSDSSTSCSYTTCTPYTVTGSWSTSCFTQISYTTQGSLYTFQTTDLGTAPFGHDWYVDGISYGYSPTLSLVIDSLDNTNGVSIQVTVTDANVCVTSDYIYITNANQAGCNVYASFTNQDSLYTFFASNTGGTPISYAWYVDSLYIDSSASFTTVVTSNFSTICLYVTDANGSICSDCISLSTNPGGGSNTCQAYFTIYPDSASGVTGYYYGYNNSTPNVPVFWDFGDGNTSTDPYPTHTYAQPGNYIICLTVGSPNTLCYDTYCDSSFYVFKTAGGLMTQLTINNPTGINELSANNNLEIYPNPATTMLNIKSDFDIERVRIVNLQGQVVLEINTATTMINIEKLSAGVYVVETTNGKSVSRNKFIKQ
jgi:PKD repeat protein